MHASLRSWAQGKYPGKDWAQARQVRRVLCVSRGRCGGFAFDFRVARGASAHSECYICHITMICDINCTFVHVYGSILIWAGGAGLMVKLMKRLDLSKRGLAIWCKNWVEACCARLVSLPLSVSLTRTLTR